MKSPKEVLILLPLGLLAAASGAAPAAAALLGAAAALPLMRSRAAGADEYWEITPEQYFEKGMASLKGDGVPQDFHQFAEALKAAAKKGHVGAMRELGTAHFTGRGAERDKFEALAWFQKGAEKDDPLCIYRLADFLRRGYGVPEDKAQATENVKKAAELGCPEAQLELSRLLKAGEEGLEKDEKAAFGWLEKAAAQENVEAMTALAEAYENGDGAEKDLEKGGALRRRLAELEKA
ncbi:MAG: sel1 repeat family protein [Deltaproteobacteria bacterium]|jgi:TPR repeat protein|nr:sel1 repeat family protein [Deltaproteobacteria bacterium]